MSAREVKIEQALRAVLSEAVKVGALDPKCDPKLKEAVQRLRRFKKPFRMILGVAGVAPQA